MSTNDLITLLKQDPVDKIKTDDDLVHFCELGVNFYKSTAGQSSVARSSMWKDSDLALALREGANNHEHIDFGQVSQKDHKVFIMYRKFGFGGLEGAIETIGLRKTYALARLVASFPDNPLGVVPFASSTQAWLKRVSQQAKVGANRPSRPLDFLCVGPETRHRIDRATRVMDGIPALHEEILPTPTSSCTLYVPEVHVLVYGPPPQIVRKRLFFEGKQWRLSDCLTELIWALALADEYPHSDFTTLLSDPSEPGRYEAITKRLDGVKSKIEAVANFLVRNEAIDTGQKLKALIQ